MNTFKGWVVAVAASAALAACTHGEDADPPLALSVTIAGTAAKGAALAGATVSVRCAAGTGTVPTATTASSGAYTITISGASLPCALKVVGTDGSTFHSLVAGTGTSGSFSANITPLTEMVMAHATGATPAAAYGAFGSSSTLTAARVTDGVAYVVAALAPVTNLSGVNPLTTALVVGDQHDQKIDAAMARLASNGVTLAQTVAAIVANPSASDVVAAPLRPSANGCAWLRSGNYRMVSPFASEARWQTPMIALNATTLIISDQDGVPVNLTPAGACQYTANEPGWTHSAMVSSAGILLVHTQSTTSAQRVVSIGLPAQSLPVSEFAGAWNIAGWDPIQRGRVGSTIAQTDVLTLDATGQITAVSRCMGLAPCTAGTGPFPRFTANLTLGGFDMIENGATNARVFMFKNLAGRAVIVFLAGDGQWFVGMRAEALTLPAVGAVTNFHQFSLDGNGTVSTLTADSNTVTAVDTSARTATRLQVSNSRVDMLAYDAPRNGLRHRAANSCTINGVANNCSQTVQLPGMGITLSLSVGAIPAPQTYTVTIGKPD